MKKLERKAFRFNVCLGWGTMNGSEQVNLKKSSRADDQSQNSWVDPQLISLVVTASRRLQEWITSGGCLLKRVLSKLPDQFKLESSLAKPRTGIRRLSSR